MENLLLKKRIYQLEPPPETIEGWETELDRMRGKWGQYFKNNEEFELFAMLPLTEDQRWTVLRAVGEEAKFKREIRECTGKKGMSKKHRQLCINCCLVDRFSI